MNTTTLFTVYPVVDAKLKDKNSRKVKKNKKKKKKQKAFGDTCHAF